VGYGMHEVLDWLEEDKGYEGLFLENVYDLGLPDSRLLSDKGR